MIVVWRTSRGAYGWASLERKRDEKRIDRIRNRHEVCKVYPNWSGFYSSDLWSRIKQSKQK